MFVDVNTLSKFNICIFCRNTDCHVLSADSTGSNQVSSLNTSTIYRVVLQASRSGELLYTICSTVAGVKNQSVNKILIVTQ